MKKILLTFSSLALTVSVFAFTVNANTKTRLSVEVPFACSIGNTVVAPGKYSVEVTRDQSGGATVGLVDSKGKRVALAIGRIAANNRRTHSDLIFRKNGSERVLSGVVLRDHVINL